MTVPPPVPIAIVGMACRLPGDVSSPSALWTKLSAKYSGWSGFPEDRFKSNGFYHPNQEQRGTFHVKGAHFLAEDIGLFDAPFFNSSAAEAMGMDPQQRLLLEVTYEAFENGGFPLEEISGKDVGVFVASTLADYKVHVMKDLDEAPRLEGIGNDIALLSNRISYVFDLQGPSLTIDTACSSSLTAMHYACKSLTLGESSQAVVSGCHLNMTPETFVTTSTLGLLSETGKCFPFDERAQSGFGRGEGVCALVLKRVDDAVRDGDAIRAIIRNTGVNQDGKTRGITVPNPNAQIRLIRKVYSELGWDPKDTSVLEAHGTGTKVGDPIEAKALAEVFCNGPGHETVLVGSIKSNIGHLEGTSGLVSVMKAAMMLERGFLLPNCDFRSPNKEIPFDKYNLQVLQSQKPWPRQTKCRMSVNNFGFGGANGHVVLESLDSFSEQAQALNKKDKLLSSGYWEPRSLNDTVAQANKTQLFILSAIDQGTLARQCTGLAMYLKQNPKIFSVPFMQDLAYTLNHRRSMFPWKAAVSANSLSTLIQELDSTDITMARATENPRLNFVFTGQGGSQAQMGYSLIQAYPTFAAVIEKAELVLNSLGAGWSLQEELSRDKKATSVGKAHISQPACTAIQLGLVDLLRSWGITPSKVTGHSSGEIAAAYAAGALDIEDAMKIAYYRGHLVAELSTTKTDLRGSMMAVGCTREVAQKMLDKLSDPSKVVVACVNSSKSMTLSGDEEAIVELESMFAKESMMAKRLPVDAAYHSHHMKLVADKYRVALKGLAPKAQSTVEFHSSLTGTKAELSTLGTEYWVQNLTNPVEFVRALESISDPANDEQSKPDVYVEIGPHSLMKGPVKEMIASHEQSNIEYLPSLQRGVDATDAMLGLASQLVVSGVCLNLDAINCPTPSHRQARILKDLPQYSWNHTNRYWAESRVIKDANFVQHVPNDLLGRPVPAAANSQPMWRSFVSIDKVPWIADHKVQGQVLFPAAGFICMAMEAELQHTLDNGSEVKSVVFRDISINSALIMPVSDTIELQTSLTPTPASITDRANHWHDFRISSYSAIKGWTLHARGLVAAEIDEKTSDCLSHYNHASGTEADSAAISVSTHDAVKLYEVLNEGGFEYGPLFQCIDKVSIKSMTDRTVVETDIIVPDSKLSMPKAFESDWLTHPIVLDTCMQTLLSFMTKEVTKMETLLLPVAVKKLAISAKSIGAAAKRIRCDGSGKFAGIFAREFCGSFVVADPSTSEVLINMQGLTFKAINLAPSDEEELPQVFHRMAWAPYIPMLSAGAYAKVFQYDSEPEITGPADKGSSSNRAYMVLANFVKTLAHQNPHMKILEVGGGQGDLATIVINSLQDATGNFNIGQYDFCDASSTAIEAAKERIKSHGGKVNFKTFDPLNEATAQDFEKSDYDVILMAVSSGGDNEKAIEAFASVRNLLKASGSLLVVSGGAQSLNGKVEVNSSLTLTEQEWNDAFKSAGYSGIDGSVDCSTDTNNVHFMASTAVSASKQDGPQKTFIIGSDGTQELQTILMSRLRETEQLQAERVSWSDGVDQEYKDSVVIVLDDPQRSLLASLTPAVYATLKNMVLHASGIFWVAPGMSTTHPGSNLVTGFARSVMSEVPGIHFITFGPDMPQSKEELGAKDLAFAISKLFAHYFLSLNTLSIRDKEFVQIGENICVPRIVEDKNMHGFVSQEIRRKHQQSLSLASTKLTLRLALEAAGALDTMFFEDLCYKENQLPDDQVEIEVEASGMNFKDVLIAHGQVNGGGLGQECSGIVTTVGNSVTTLVPGDRVCVVAEGSFATHVRVAATSAVKFPDTMSFVDAATVPIVFLTAYYALFELARIQPGETLLIHSAAGGLGQAAIMLAQSRKAKVFVTVSTEEKTNLLMDKFGIPRDQIFHSRTTQFGQQILEATDGRGVDVILNSLVGEQLRTSWECIAACGRFIEVGKKDIVSNNGLGMAPFERNVSFSSVDLTVVNHQRCQLLQKMFVDLMAMFDRGELTVIKPQESYPFSEIKQALTKLAGGKVIGKIVIERRNDEGMVMAKTSHADTTLLRSDAAYAIMGGTGGIGRSICRWLAKNGAQHIILASRSGGVATDTASLVEELGKQNVEVSIVKCDASKLDQVAKLVSDTPQTIRGVINAIAVFKDELFEKQSLDDFNDVLQCKVESTWNLHKALSHTELDFFIMLSSIASIVGNRGQTAYSTANGFMDGFAHYRVAQGLPATSINLSVVRDIGTVDSEEKVQEISRQTGAYAIKEPVVLALIKAAVNGMASETADHQIISGLTGSAEHWYSEDPRYSHLSQTREESDSQGPKSLKQSLKQNADRKKQTQAIIESLSAKLAQMMSVPEEDITPDRSLSSVGIDSLVAVEVAHWISREVDAQISMLELLESPSINALVEIVCTKSPLVTEA